MSLRRIHSSCVAREVTKTLEKMLPLSHDKINGVTTNRIVKRKILRGGLKNANFSAEGGLVITMKEGGAPECQTFCQEGVEGAMYYRRGCST